MTSGHRGVTTLEILHIISVNYNNLINCSFLSHRNLKSLKIFSYLGKLINGK